MGKLIRGHFQAYGDTKLFYIIWKAIFMFYYVTSEYVIVMQSTMFLPDFSSMSGANIEAQ